MEIGYIKNRKATSIDISFFVAIKEIRRYLIKTLNMKLLLIRRERIKDMTQAINQLFKVTYFNN